jgi:hypothetical protein
VDVRHCGAAGPCLQPASFRGRRYDGLFYLWYRHIHCRKAPCPKGGWAISLAREKAPGERTSFYLAIRIARYVYASGTPARLRLEPVLDGSDREKVTIDGTVEIGADGTATLRPRTARYGNPPFR